MATTLQYYTFPLELIGLTLATIEVRFPRTAKRLAKYINKRGPRKELLIGLWIPVAIVLVLLVTFNESVVRSLLPGVVLTFVLAAVYTISSNWVNGREVGTLGIIIAGFGVLGEAYQFTTQLVV